MFDLKTWSTRSATEDTIANKYVKRSNTKSLIYVKCINFQSWMGNSKGLQGSPWYIHLSLSKGDEYGIARGKMHISDMYNTFQSAQVPFLVLKYKFP